VSGRGQGSTFLPTRTRTQLNLHFQQLLDLFFIHFSIIHRPDETSVMRAFVP
jgi:hypothetical protein